MKHKYLKTNLTSFYISLTGDTVKFLFRFKWLVKRGLRRPLFLFALYLLHLSSRYDMATNSASAIPLEASVFL
jgi:hypothetical protein